MPRAKRRRAAGSETKNEEGDEPGAGTATSGLEVQAALDAMDDGVLLIILEQLPSLRSRLAAAMTTTGFMRVAFAPSSHLSTFGLSERGRRCCSREPSLLSPTLPAIELWRSRSRGKGIGLPV